MASFYINTNKVDAVSDSIKTVADKCDTILSTVNGYDVSNEGGFDFSGAKSAIANNLEGAKIKFNNTVALLTAVVKVHGGIQESVNDTGDTSSTGCGNKGCSGCGGGCSSRGGGCGGGSARGSGCGTSGSPSATPTYQDGSTVSPSPYEHGEFVNYYQYNFKESYGYGTTIASAGCGPTSMAMVLTYLLDETHDPVEIANWSLKRGYHVEGQGTAWSFFKACADAYNVECNQMSVTKENIINNLKAGKIIIMNVGPGHFTSGGHYIVLRGITADGKIIVADPNSEKRSKQVWDIDVFLKEGKQMWAFDGGKKKTATTPETTPTNDKEPQNETSNETTPETTPSSVPAAETTPETTPSPTPETSTSDFDKSSLLNYLREMNGNSSTGAKNIEVDESNTSADTEKTELNTSDLEGML